MNTDRLNTRKTELQARQKELVTQIEGLDKQVQLLLAEKQTAVNNYNAVQGAILLVDELLADAPVAECECLTTQ